MSVTLENINAVISQRIRLACKDMAYADAETVMEKVISQGRVMDAEQLRQEREHIRSLSAQAMGKVELMKHEGREMFKRRIGEMHLSRKALTELVSHSAKELRRTMDSARVGHWDVPESIYSDLDKLCKLKLSEGEDSMLDYKRMQELLAYCLSTQGLVEMADMCAEAAVEGKKEEEKEQGDELSLAAIAELRANGALPEEFAGLSDSKVLQLIRFAESRQAMKLKEEELAELWGKSVVSRMVLELAEVKADAAVGAQLDDEECILRRELAVAVYLNLRACGKLPAELEKLSDEELACIACAGTEINYYFDKAAAPDLDVDTVLGIIESLLYGVVALVFGITFAVESETVFAVLFVATAVLMAAEAVDRTVTAMFPAGLSETALGVKLSCSVAQMRRNLAALGEKCLEGLVAFVLEKMILSPVIKLSGKEEAKESSKVKHSRPVKQEEQAKEYQMA